MSKQKIISKRALIILALIVFSARFGIAQPNCNISIDTPTPVCPGIYFELSVFDQPQFKYIWEQKDENAWVEVGDDYFLGTSIEDSTVFRVTVIDTIAKDTCRTEAPYFGVATHQQIEIEFHQLQLTCTNGDNQNGNSARVRATAYGEFEPDEYQYEWQVSAIHLAPGDSSMAIDLKGHQYYEIIVRDKHGCPKTEKYWTETFTNPEVEIFSDPDTAYLQKPYITFSFDNLSEDSIAISNHFWWFEDYFPDPDFENTSDLLEPTYKYDSIGEWDVILTVYNEVGCDTSFLKTVYVKPVDLFIPNIFSPGGDGINDYFVITENPPESSDETKTLIDYYVSSRLVVFNRAGRTIFSMDNYDNSWDGGDYPDGVYYYVLECNGVSSTDVYKGSVTIIRPK